jgi:hypothetical protein
VTEPYSQSYWCIVVTAVLHPDRGVAFSWGFACREPGHMLAVGPDELLSKVTRYLEEVVQVRGGNSL